MLCYYGKGGFTHSEAYNMPRYLRTFYLKQIEKIALQKQEQQKKHDNKQSGKSEVFGPPVMPKANPNQ
tara:strand:- start:501 stop:704 length:204 start_codon:yes stop_codon:yes gene_type:complete